MKSEWKDYPCQECKKPMLLNRQPTLACPDCMEWFYEHLTGIIDKSYDKNKLNDFTDVWNVLVKLWCWCQPQAGRNIQAKMYPIGVDSNGDNIYRKTKVAGKECDLIETVWLRNDVHF